MANTEKEPVELTIKKMEIAWEMEQQVQKVAAGVREEFFKNMLERFEQAYAKVSTTIKGSGQTPHEG